ncbi:MAG: hypothetical protein SGJ19_17295 [Planctomycetia bacterium]|nr:hypothetical protein [Planctomycetia bacterium]
MRCPLICLAILTVLAGVGRASSIPSIYWSESGGIARANIDGGGAVALTPGFVIGGLALDRARDQLFFTDIVPSVPIGPSGIVNRGTADGAGVAPILRQLPAPLALALDRNAGQVIWSDAELHSISIAGYDGAHSKTILEPEPSIANINGLAFDPWERKLYFSYINPLVDNLRPGGIARMNLDGSDHENVVSGLVSPQGLAVDHVRGFVYWADPEFGKGLIGRAGLDGSDPMKWTGGLGSPQGVAVDPYTNQIYWTDSATGKIQTGTPFVPAIDLVTDRDQPNAIGLLIHSGLDGDTNDDGQVDLFDLNDVRNHFGRTPGPGPGDADLDGDVDIQDLNAVRNNYGSRFTAPAESNGVPEPSSALLAAAGILAVGVLARKRKSPTLVRR